ncbi:MAG TPA: hypothetical protein VJ812_11165 [Gemmatimonadaceae bacterium]|jgi:hypothetical protein|nr:hypothetical protein [Gemmatimonadaceae bacterium]
MRIARTLWCGATLLLAPLARLGAQDDDAPRTPRVPVDRYSGALGTALPFDERFMLVGDAARSLLRLELTYARAEVLPVSRCESIGVMRAPPDDSLRRSSWRRTAAAADSFWLPVEPLQPNVEYTFCFASMETLSAADSAAFQQRSVAALRAVLRRPMGERGNTPVTEAGLRAFRRALIEALPRAEHLEVTPGSIFDSAATSETVQQVFLDFATHDDARQDAAREFDAQRDPDVSNTLANFIVRLGADSAFWRLPAVSAERLAPSAAERTRLTLGASLGRTLWRVSPTNAATIAGGQTAITLPRPPIEGNANVTRRWSPAEVLPWEENLDTTLARLRDLGDLLAALHGEPAAHTRAGITREQLERIQALVDGLRIAAAAQRSSLRQLVDAVTGMDSAVVLVVRTVVARELEHVGLWTSTAASYQARARWYVSQDLGVLYGTRGDDREVSPYFGLNFYLRPVNKRAPLRGLSLSRRLALTLGVTTQNLKEEDEYSGVISGKAFVVGAGVRVADFFRVSYAAPLVYTFSGPDDDRQRRVAAFHALSLSIDADLREVISGLANAIFPR